MKMNLGVSIVIPMYNAQSSIEMVLSAIFKQNYAGSFEIIVVNDGSIDNSLDIARKFQDRPNFKIINQPHSGAVSATNNGFRDAKHDIICNVDSDVVLCEDWTAKIIEEFDGFKIGATQGYFKTPKKISSLARIAGYDLEERYDNIKGKYVTQVSTGNTAYRKSALDKVGLFDPRFKYGYDNDMSYRLINAGYLLVLRKDAVCYHYWKTKFSGYLKQQYWSGYGRMQVIKKHKNKLFGDSVSGPRMILHVPFTLSAILLFIFGAVIFFFYSSPFFLWVSFLLFGMIFVERISFALKIIKKQKDLCVIFMPLVHLLRNMAWCSAFLKWSFDFIIGEKNA